MTHTLTAADWLAIMTGADDEVAPYCDWLEEQGLPACAACARDLPALAHRLRGLSAGLVLRSVELHCPPAGKGAAGVRYSAGTMSWYVESLAADVAVRGASEDESHPLHPAFDWLWKAARLTDGTIWEHGAGQNRYVKLAIKLEARES